MTDLLQGESELLEVLWLGADELREFLVSLHSHGLKNQGHGNILTERVLFQVKLFVFEHDGGSCFLRQRRGGHLRAKIFLRVFLDDDPVLGYFSGPKN